MMAAEAEVAILRDEVKRLRDGLTNVSNWRRDAHAYDRDAGHKLRSFDEETVGEIEDYARDVLGGDEP